MPVAPDEALWFIGQMRHTKGKYAGKPFTVYPFQEDWIRALLALNRQGRRKVREALLGIARKNGKTELTAALALCLLVLDREPGGEVVGAAGKREQAKIMLNAAKRMVRYSKIGGQPLTDFLEIRRDHIYFPELDARYLVISADGEKEMGLNPHAILVDEAHVALSKDRELYDALLTGQGARENPLSLLITTAGPRPSGPCHNLYEYGKKVASGAVNDPEFLMLWHEADSDLAIDDPKAWRQANPAMGEFLFEDTLGRLARNVKAGKMPEYTFRRLHLNQWTTAAERWLPYRKWEACGRKPVIEDDAEIWVGVDAAVSRDTFAVAWITVDEFGNVHGRMRRFLPREGGYIDPKEVETFILGLSQRYRIRDVAYDPAYMQIMASVLGDRGLPVEPFPQSPQRMTEVAETLQRIVLDSRLRHGNDPVLNEQMAAVAVKAGERGVRISKKESGLAIDGVVALGMAIQRAVGGEETAADDFALAV